MKLCIALLFVVAPLSAQNAPPTFTIAQFKSLSWIVGAWRGSGGSYPSFFEEYRMIDDSTMKMRTLKDSTFKVASDSSVINFRNGVIRNGSSVVVKLRGDTVRFERAGGGGNGYTFVRQSGTAWTALLDGRNGPGVIYQMRRVQNTGK